jgi:PAS domain-containing protein
LDRNGVVRFVNPAAETLFGRKAEELIGELFGFPLTACEAKEIDIIRRDGGTRTAEVRVEEMNWEGKSTFVASLRDITERKQTEEELQKAYRRTSTLYMIDRAVSQSLNLKEVLRAGLDATLKAMDIEAGGFFLLEPDGKRWSGRDAGGCPGRWNHHCTG